LVARSEAHSAPAKFGRCENSAAPQADPPTDAKLMQNGNLEYAVNWLVRSVSGAVETIVAAGRKGILEPTQILVGRLAVVNDPFGNALVSLDLCGTLCD
jgi:hypothetical protein